MKLSIIIPVYHTQDTLERCVESVLQQSFANYELILVDDESPDECPRLCDEYAKKDGRIKVIHTPHGGLGKARNIGIKEATGEYITFIDSDDAIEEDTLQALMDELAEYPEVDILEYPIKERIGNPQRERTLSFEPKNYEDSLDYWFSERVYDHTYACNKIFRSEILKHGDARFPEGRSFEDVAFMPLILQLYSDNSETPVVRVTNKGLYLYHWNKDGITAQAKGMDMLCLYGANFRSLFYSAEKFKKLENREKKKQENKEEKNIEHREEAMLAKYRSALEEHMAKTLNAFLDLCDFEPAYIMGDPLLYYVRWFAKQGGLHHRKLKLFNILGLKLCVINRLIHKIYKRRQ